MYLPELIPPKPPRKFPPISYRSVGIVLGTSFFTLLLILNAPTIVSAIAYPFSHTQDSNNKLLTNQYQGVYGDQSATSLPLAGEANLGAAVSPTANDNLLSIPKIDVSAPIQQVPKIDDPTILNALKTGVVLYPGSSYPGTTGTTIIIGHSSSEPPWTKYSAVFALLDKLAPNDLMYVSFKGKTYVYQVTGIETGSVEHIMNSGLAGDLILTSCWPIGTDQHRIAVVANLLN